MLIELLDGRNLDVDLAEACDLWALYKGGREFRKSIERMLPKRAQEDTETYKLRKSQAHYLNYFGPIVNYFAAWVFSRPAEAKSEPTKVDDYYALFRKNCDGVGTSLAEMLQERFTRALVQGSTWMLIDFPADDEENPVTTRADWMSRGLGDAFVTALAPESVMDWETDDRGEFEWVIVKYVDDKRASPAQKRGMVKAVWTIWKRDGWERYEATYEAGKPPPEGTDIPLKARGPIATNGRVPIVRIELGDDLWLGNALESPCREQMRQRNAHSWALGRSAYAQRVFKGDDAPEITHDPGKVIMLGPDESLLWDAPPSDVFAPIKEYNEDLREEIHRIAHQMALGVKNSAAAIGRSGDSKQIDQDASVIMVEAFAAAVRAADKTIMDLVTLGRSEKDQITGKVVERTEWTIGGMTGYDASDATAILTNAALFGTLGIESPTAHREVQKRAVHAYLPDADQATLDQIDKEIDAAVTAESVRVMRDNGVGPGDEGSGGHEPPIGGEKKDGGPPRQTELATRPNAPSPPTSKW